MFLPCTVSEIVRLWLKIANFFNLPRLYLGVILFDIQQYLRQQKTRILRLSYSFVCMNLSLAVLIEQRLVRDRQTDKHTTIAWTTLVQRRLVKRPLVDWP